MKKEKEKYKMSPSAKKFGELMREAEENDAAREEMPYIRPVDYSFMNEYQPVRKRRLAARPLRVASILLCFFVLVTGTAIWINSEPANALRQELERKLYQIKESLFMSHNDVEKHYSSENKLSSSIDDMEDMNKAHEFLPDLPVPEYIPEGQELEILKMEKIAEDDYNASYEFVANDGKEFIISVYRYGKEIRITDSMLEMEYLSLEDRDIYIWEDDATDTHGITMIKDVFVINVTGDISREEMLLVAENIN